MDDYALPPFGPSLFHVSGKAGCRYRKLGAVRLVELNPRYFEAEGVRPDRLCFACPRCRLGLVSVWLREGGPSVDGVTHGCDRLPPDFETLSITPSIAGEGKCRRCPGWHGFITNGEAL